MLLEQGKTALTCRPCCPCFPGTPFEPLFPCTPGGPRAPGASPISTPYIHLGLERYYVALANDDGTHKHVHTYTYIHTFYHVEKLSLVSAQAYTTYAYKFRSSHTQALASFEEAKEPSMHTLPVPAGAIQSHVHAYSAPPVHESIRMTVTRAHEHTMLASLINAYRRLHSRHSCQAGLNRRTWLSHNG
jgi:hypothetical protein